MYGKKASGKMMSKASKMEKAMPKKMTKKVMPKKMGKKK